MYLLIWYSLQIADVFSHLIDAPIPFRERFPNSIITAQQIVLSQVLLSASNSSTAAPVDTQMQLVFGSGF
jgi:hypothetical protein